MSSSTQKELEDLRKLRSVLAAVKETVENIHKDIETARENKIATSEELLKLQATIEKA